MDFIFLRHGHYHQPKNVPSALLPHPLTDEGMQQCQTGAEKLWSILKTHKLALPPALESSSALRAFQTASILAAQLAQNAGLQLPILETDQLTERSMGAMANLSVSEIEAILDKDPRYALPPQGWKSSRNYKLPYPGAESLAEAGKRVAEHIVKPTRFLGQYPSLQQQVRILVGHGASFRHACVELGILSEQEVKKYSMYHAEPLYFKHENNGWKLISGAWKIRQQQDQPD